MGYDLSMPERYIERLTVSIPFSLAAKAWDDIIILARQMIERPTFNPTRFWIALDEEDSDKMGLVLQEQSGESITTCVIDIEESILTEDQVNTLKLMHLMTTPGYSVD